MRALGRPVRPIIQAFESVALIAHQPPVHRSPRHAPVCGHLAHRPTVANYCQDRLVPLLSHAHLPHARERDKSAEVGVTHQPKVCNPSAEGLLRPISRTCTGEWLGRKDSNLQPSDPESAALPLRHSPKLLLRGLHCSSYHRAYGAVLASLASREIVADFVTSPLGAFSRRPSEAPRYLPPVGLLHLGQNSMPPGI